MIDYGKSYVAGHRRSTTKSRSLSQTLEARMDQKLTVSEARQERSRRIKREQKALGKTLRDLHRDVQEALGKATRGTSYGAVRAIVEGEVDHPRPNVVREIARSLGVCFEYLMDLEGPKNPQQAAMKKGTTPSDAAAAEEDEFSDLRAALERHWFYRGLAHRFDLQVAFAMLAADLGIQPTSPDALDRILEGLALSIIQLGQTLGPQDGGLSEEYIQAALLAARVALPPREHLSADDHAAAKEIVGTLYQLGDANISQEADDG